MHTIERFGLVALVFLIVTVFAVFLWDGGKKKEKDVHTAGAAAQPLTKPAKDPAGRRLSLRADPEPGPLVRQPAAGLQPAEPRAATPGDTELQPLQEQAPAGTRALTHDPQPSQPLDLFPQQDDKPDPAPENPVVTRAPASESATHTYIVRAGDTLSEIAQRELGSSRRWQEIVAANRGLDLASLRVGKTLTLPGAAPAGTQKGSAAPAGAKTTSPVAKASAKDSAKTPGKATWTVGRGESLWTIAERSLGSGPRWKEIVALNPGLAPDALKQGQVLKLPADAKQASRAKSSGTATPLVAARTPSEKRGGKVH